jgi:biotin carboxyl carrier protein
LNAQGGGGATQRAKASDELGSVGAPMPGAVVEVVVKLGDAVEKGQKLAGLSAMKMVGFAFVAKRLMMMMMMMMISKQVTSVSSPCDGVVKTIHVAKGDQVKNGDELFVIEPRK